MDFMMDVIYIVLMLAFFGATVGLLHFCAGLMDKGGRP